MRITNDNIGVKVKCGLAVNRTDDVGQWEEVRDGRDQRNRILQSVCFRPVASRLGVSRLLCLCPILS